ncbi:MAG: hypothetical protein OXC00_10205 [Acidimicrobiaceae bacterium]|nr:hypothetical protein [Acidimicrobiaceae bacterium]
MTALQAGEGAQELALALTLDARQSDDLALPGHKLGVPESVAAEPFHSQYLGPQVFGTQLGRESGLEPPPYDRIDDVVLGQVVRGVGQDQPPVSQYGDPIRDRLHLVDAMRDVHDRTVAAADLCDQAEQFLDAGGHEVLGRLVENKHGGFLGDRSCDRHHEALVGLEVADVGLRVDVRNGPPISKDRPRPLVLLAYGRATVFGGAEPHVLSDREIGEQGRLLEDDGKSGFPDQIGVRPVHRSTVDLDRAAVGANRAGRHADQRRLARAVLADEPVDLASPNRQADVGESLNAGVVLVDAVEPQYLGTVVTGCYGGTG